MKRFLSILTLFTFLFAFIACSDSKKSSSEPTPTPTPTKTWDPNASVCDVDNEDKTDPNSCLNSNGAMHFIGAYDLVSITVRNCKGDGDDLIFDAEEGKIKGEIATKPQFLGSNVIIPIYYKLQLSDDSSPVTECTANSWNTKFFYGEVKHDVEADITKFLEIFQGVGLTPISGDRQNIYYEIIGADKQVIKLDGYEIILKVKFAETDTLAGPNDKDDALLPKRVKEGKLTSSKYWN